MKERLRYRSWTIGAKTLASHALLALFAIVFACVVAYALSFRYVQDQAMEELVQQAEYIASCDVTDGTELSIPDEKTIEQYQSLTSSMVLYVDRDYLATHIGASNEPAPGGPEFARLEIISSIDRQFVARMFEGETVADIRRFDFASGVILFAGSPVRNTAGKVVGGVILAQPVAQLHKLTTVLQMLLFMTAAVTVLLAVVMATKMTQVLTNPIRRLTQVARRISEGEYGARIALGTQDELGELGNTLNTLSARLSNVIERLREERDKLELIIGSIGEGIIAVNADFQVTHKNQAFLELMELRRRGTRRASRVRKRSAALHKLLEELHADRRALQGPLGQSLAAQDRRHRLAAVRRARGEHRRGLPHSGRQRGRAPRTAAARLRGQHLPRTAHAADRHPRHGRAAHGRLYRHRGGKGRLLPRHLSGNAAAGKAGARDAGYVAPAGWPRDAGDGRIGTARHHRRRRAPHEAHGRRGQGGIDRPIPAARACAAWATRTASCRC